ncbi:hypothetical protein ABCR94_07770 [Streptomyces sp. 21So2-11]|uniref:hypothetical protein n=1 Tax=Streptomyces sp. 21So2-11 TaxID=3144408 RepID=UPI00321B351C
MISREPLSRGLRKIPAGPPPGRQVCSGDPRAGAPKPEGDEVRLLTGAGTGERRERAAVPFPGPASALAVVPPPAGTGPAGGSYAAVRAVLLGPLVSAARAIGENGPHER